MQARFSLQGELLAADADLPTHLGLHHHGEEPEVSSGPRQGFEPPLEEDLYGDL